MAPAASHDPGVSSLTRPGTRHLPVVVEPWEGSALDAVARLHGRPGLVWLDSALTARPGALPGAADAPAGRWSVVTSDPRWTLTAYGDDVLLDGACGPRRLPGGALQAFARCVEAEPCAVSPLTPGGTALPFAGGAVGYMGFELGREVERLPATTVDDVGAPSLAAGWYDAALVWDALEHRAWLVGQPDAVAALAGRLRALPRAAREASASGLRANFTRAAYLRAVSRARDYIRAGDIYQVNLAQRFSAPVRGEGLDLYRQLRDASPAPHAAYLDLRGAFGGVEVVSSSPERFLSLDGDLLETRPIKGTRPRGDTPEEDRCLADALRASTKDLAEHVMIVDLERNDLGRVAVPGTVHVPAFAALESFRQVHHLTSTVRARLRPGVSLGQLLAATFPGGSITGAPKVRAMEIIDELEPHVRGVYTGAIGYVSAHGRVDFNIAIRTVTLADDVAHFHAGGAIVHDSDPMAEYAETMHKARGMARALRVSLPDEVS
jgi:para-aminobenzoate synthetase component I